MINVYLEGHKFDYEVFELLRLFYEDKDINIIKDKALVDDQSLLLVSVLKQQKKIYSVETCIYREKEIILKDYIHNVENIKIYKKDINKLIKNAVKKSIYNVLQKNCNKETPWGILTGIRPTKIVHELLDKSVSFEEIYEVLTKQYLISDKNANLLIDIANTERKYVYPLDDKKFSLYVGIPFCPSRCIYCSFPSHSLDKWGSLVDEYTDKLIYEINCIGELTVDKKINTVYIGGGTPTAIPKENLERIIKAIYSTFNKNDIKEFTVEAGRPDTINEDILYMLKKNNIKRISINPQTMNDTTLSTIGRNHKSHDIIKAYTTAKQIGFDSINMDIIVGLPNEDTTHIINTLEEIKKLNPDNLTVHTMAVKRASKLKESINDYDFKNVQTIQNMIDITKKYSLDMNMKPYYMYKQKQTLGNFENIGYSKSNKECIYNIMIMEERETILAAGAGATSKIFYPEENRLERIPNVKGVKEYIERIEEMIEKKKKILKNN